MSDIKDVTEIKAEPSKELVLSEEEQARAAYFTHKERDLLKDAIENGAKPASVTLVNQLYNLFIEGYSCKEIAALNPGLSEKDIIYYRFRNAWDRQREEYSLKLKGQIHEKMIKQKLESVEFLTNMLAVYHKDQRAKMLRYLQTGKEEDRPETWITGSTSYKSIVEVLQKITGEDRVTRQEIKTESKSEVKISGSINTPLTPELQDLLLKRLAKEDKQDAKED